MCRLPPGARHVRSLLDTKKKEKSWVRFKILSETKEHRNEMLNELKTAEIIFLTCQYLCNTIEFCIGIEKRTTIFKTFRMLIEKCEQTEEWNCAVRRRMPSESPLHNV